MNVNLSQLSLNELYDKLSESTTLYTKSMLNGFSEKEFTELRALIESLQNEIAKRKAADPSHNIFPPQQSASA